MGRGGTTATTKSGEAAAAQTALVHKEEKAVALPTVWLLANPACGLTGSLCGPPKERQQF